MMDEEPSHEPRATPQPDTLQKFVYDPPRKHLVRLFQLDITNTDDGAPLSGRLMSYTFHEPVGDMISTLADFIREDAEAVMLRLSGSEKFLALSYSWGSDSATYPLYLSTIDSKLDRGGLKWPKRKFCKGEVVQDHEPERNGYIWIRASLRAFLLEMRRQKFQRFIWVDAICIAQGSVIDKNNQIPQMREIYEYAEAVYVWLGEATEMEKGALRVMPGIAEKLLSVQPTPDVPLETLFHALSVPEPSHQIWDALAAIISRPWWSRLWTLQEVVVAQARPGAVASFDNYKTPNVTVLSGDVKVPWDSVDKFAAAMGKHGLKQWLISGKIGYIPEHLHGFDAVTEIRSCRATFAWSVVLSNLLVSTRRRQATEPADMVFGMLALLDRTTRQDLALDISMPLSQVFIGFAKHYIRNEVKECILNHNATRHRIEGLPSWCPNFASTEETVAIGTRWFGRGEERREIKAQTPHAGYQPRGQQSGNKWAQPRSKLYYPRYLTNALTMKDDFRNQYNTNNPRQIALMSNSDAILASGVVVDILTDVIQSNPGAESANFLSRDSVRETLSWNQRCRQLASNTLSLQDESQIDDIYARTVVANRVTMDVTDETEIIIDRDEKLDLGQRYREMLRSMQAAANENHDDKETAPPAGKTSFTQCLAAMSKRRTFFATDNGRIGLGPRDARKGDVLVVIFYCPTPYLIRPAGQDTWAFVGETYVRGLMYSEALGMFDRGQLHESKWVIA